MAKSHMVVDGGRNKIIDDKNQPRMRLGKYELGKTLGQGNFGKVKFAINFETDQPFAIKVLDKTKIFHLNIADQVLKSPKTHITYQTSIPTSSN